jgi:KipI family sensor histidine kinase inhibitor
MTNRRLLDYSPEAVLLECTDLTETVGLLASLRDEAFPWVSEVIPGARTLLIRVNRLPTQAQRQRLLTLRPAPPVRTERPPLTIEVDYNGPDLEEVAAFTKMTREEVVRTHTEQVWTVGFCGFAPGFGYLRGENERLKVPRRSSPRTKVPARSVGLAGEWSGIYPRVGPGGWQLIGRAHVKVWDLHRENPALLQPGMRVRFVERVS